jgi:phosphoribosylglycinamide formyltransferase 1
MSAPAPARLGVLASGSGSNLQSLLDACASGRLHAQVVSLVCNVPGARCLERARAAGVPATLLPHKQFASREAYDEAVVAELRAKKVELVCLAGFMRLVTPVLLRAFPDRVLNIHPSLLPSFPGLHAARQALRAGVRLAGCTVHFVDEGTDTGPVIVQAAVPILDGDTEESLQARIQVQEHLAYPRAVELVASGQLRLEADGARRRVRWLGSPIDLVAPSLAWPPLGGAAPGEKQGVTLAGEERA